MLIKKIEKNRIIPHFAEKAGFDLPGQRREMHVHIAGFAAVDRSAEILVSFTAEASCNKIQFNFIFGYDSGYYDCKE